MSTILSYSEFLTTINKPNLKDNIDGHLMYIDYYAQSLSGFPPQLKIDYSSLSKLPMFEPLIKQRMQNAEIIGFIYQNPNKFYENEEIQKSALEVENFLRPYLQKDKK